MREEVEELKNEVISLKEESSREESFAMELIKDQKKQNKRMFDRMFVIILVILSMWFATIGYLVYVLNDIGYVETEETIDIDNVDNIQDSDIQIGDREWAE